MTRPQIIRADTIDLQDKTSPTAQDHSHQPQHPAPLGIGPAAPHQQATLRSVETERYSEEVRLQNAWEHAGDSLRDDQGSDDESTVTHVNGQLGHKETTSDANGDLDDDDADMHDADEEDMDDDMMDKMSSSPSIDDGGYFPFSQPQNWPTRGDSLTPMSSPLASVASSSPFMATPIHYPLSVAGPRQLFSASTYDTDNLSLLSHSTSHSISPSPTSLHLSQQLTQSLEHHHGEYIRTTDDTTDESGTMDDLRAMESPGATEDWPVNPAIQALKLVERRLQIMREDSQGSLTSELDEEQASCMLQSARRPPSNFPDDPFLEPAGPAPRTNNGTPIPSVGHFEDEEDSWETDSDADSWDADLDNDDASHDILFSDDSRFIDSGWGGECLRETEDIDFEFVYALHTFVATVEGQANATKGDTMVLLDDSNSYWWLVRVVKDSSIGYLPAEHIETPTERLARLNKHRNIDLSATMLGDTAEKSKNPLKKAMRRRNAKNVQFAPPTYVEASDYDYSSDEGEGELFGGPAPGQAQQQQQQTVQKVESEQDDLQVQPLKLGGAKEDGVRTSTDDAAKSEERTSDDSMERPLDQKVSRNGTLRNTDSFFKDENTETRKITLTPNLLRDDSSTSTTGSKERGPSLESLEKNGFADKAKDDKKKKEKKAGMLSGLFKRKDKKEKNSKGDLSSVDSDIERGPEESGKTSPQPKPSEDSNERQSNERQSNERQPGDRQSNERQSSERELGERQSNERQSSERPSEEQAAPAPAPLRQSSKSKLQKQLRARNNSPIKTKGILKTDSPMEYTAEDAAEAAENKSDAQQVTSTVRVVEAEEKVEASPAVEEQAKAPESQSMLSSMNPFKSSSHDQSNSAPKPEKVKKSKQRVQLDDFDSDEESEDPFADPDAGSKAAQQASEPVGRLSESPVYISAADAQPSGKDTFQREIDSQQPPGLTGDSSSQDTSSPAPTPPLIDSPATIVPEKSALRGTPSSTSLNIISSNENKTASATRSVPTPLKQINTSPPTSSESMMLPAWSDASLRNYLEDGSDIRDLLLVISDTTGVVPVGKDHPLMSGLFVEETKAVQGLSNELDRLLSGLMDSRMKRAGSAASKASSAKSVR